MKGLNLKELVEHIRDELEHADRERAIQGREPLFKLEMLELEVKFTVTDESTGKGGIDLKVVTFGRQGSVASEAVQTIRLQYKPLQREEGLLPPGSLAHPSSLPSPAGRS